MTRPKAATKKKFPMKTLSIDTPRHPIRARESVVNVVPKAPMANAVYCNFSFPVCLGFTA